MSRPTQLRLDAPRDYWLPVAVCSYGYFLLAPNRWRPERFALERTLNRAQLGLDDGVFAVSIDQPGGRGGQVRVRCDAPLPRSAHAPLRRAMTRMLRLDQDDRRWKRLHPVAARRGFGRLFRSPSLFEDMIKTITNCNVGWSSTLRMNELLVDRVGGGAFPTPERLAAWTPSRLKRSCRVGYRAGRIVGLARAFTSGEIDPAWFGSPQRTTEELRERLLQLDGFGPYASANVLQLLGRYDHLPIDTESYRLYGLQTGVPRPKNPKELNPLIEARYERYGKHRFLAYWFDLWRDYENRKGPAWTWEPDAVASSFTASALD